MGITWNQEFHLESEESTRSRRRLASAAMILIPYAYLCVSDGLKRDSLRVSGLSIAGSLDNGDCEQNESG
jgi:hypothetical protein